MRNPKRLTEKYTRPTGIPVLDSMCQESCLPGRPPCRGPDLRTAMEGETREGEDVRRRKYRKGEVEDGDEAASREDMMKATSWSSITGGAHHAATTDWAGSAPERAGAGPVDEEVGSVRGATARERPDIARLGA
ncbi:uncharacterized protein A4U43_C02F10850 [Asparagus officinalis]|uniref:Uncharacterized protein n=1 Tax=Asparagus officinalis TaxID=4686 RepID=A0A5P1FI80_ASPOF|nr:uncharacterized protein A4U43_C02F10850 [Asparagus officinalis]